MKCPPKRPDGLGGGVVVCGSSAWDKRRLAKAIRRNVRRWVRLILWDQDALA